MKYQHLTYYFFLLFSCAFGGCEEQIEEPTAIDGKSYFPMETNHWVTYQVDSTIYSPFLATGSETQSWEVKEVLGKPFIDNEGRDAITILRYARKDTNVSWDDVSPTLWYGVRSEERAERVEGDRRFMKLVFPISSFRNWNGNVYLNAANEDNTWAQYYRYGAYNDWNYSYSQIETPFEINGFNFENTITVAQQDKENLIEKVFATEVYAPNVGLVYREEWILKTDDSTQDGNWPERATQGHVVKMKVIDYR